MSNKTKCVQCQKPAWGVFEWWVTGKGLCVAILCRECSDKHFGKGSVGENMCYTIREPK